MKISNCPDPLNRSDLPSRILATVDQRRLKNEISIKDIRATETEQFYNIKQSAQAFIYMFHESLNIYCFFLQIFNNFLTIFEKLQISRSDRFGQFQC